jgi:predicted RNA-binding protein (virulence factor B family)
MMPSLFCGLVMADIGRYNTLAVVLHTDFGLYLDGGGDGDILLPNRYIPKNTPVEPGDKLRVFVYLDSEDRIIATTQTPKAQVGEFASLKVVEVSPVGLFLDWGLPKDLLLPYSEVKKTLREGDYCVVYLYVDEKTRRITATTYLDRHLDKTPAHYRVGQAVDLLIAARTDIGFKAIVNNNHWGLIHDNEAFKFLRSGMREKGYIKQIRADGKLNLSLQPWGKAGHDKLQTLILEKLTEAGGVLPYCDKSPPNEINRVFGVSKGSFKRALGSLLKSGAIIIHTDHIESTQQDH